MSITGYVFVGILVIALGWALLEFEISIWQRRRDPLRNNSPERLQQRRRS
jgi:hypothetical protein